MHPPIHGLQDDCGEEAGMPHSFLIGSGGLKLLHGKDPMEWDLQEKLEK